MRRNARPDNLSLPIVDLLGVFILFNPLKDLSAEQEVTGCVLRIMRRVLMLGNIDAGAWERVESSWKVDATMHILWPSCPT